MAGSRGQRPPAPELDVQRTDLPVDQERPSESELTTPEEPTKHRPDAPAARRAGTKRYRIWPHGELHRNGKRHLPGELIELSDDEAKVLSDILLPVD